MGEPPSSTIVSGRFTWQYCTNTRTQKAHHRQPQIDRVLHKAPCRVAGEDDIVLQRRTTVSGDTHSDRVLHTKPAPW
jgi:hypothetical protein